MTDERPNIITDEQLQRSLDWLREAASSAAKARAERLYMEEWLPALRAQIASECIQAGDSAAKADITARASEAYKKALLAFKEAVEKDELFRWRRSSADAVLSAWQSTNANLRAMGKLQ